jgi:pimeloyl-ACP methyl ester carboxylesterase
MLEVRSRDGTPIAFAINGRGVPLVLVHGTTADHTRWAPLMATLERFFRVYRIDRRGRSGSGDTLPYSIEREYEDVATVVEWIGEPAHVLGHSFGGLVALEAALRCSRAAVRSLVLYEPPVATLGVPPQDLLDTMDQQVARGDRDGAVTTFFRDLLGVPGEDLTLLQALPTWRLRCSAAHTMARELRAAFSYELDPSRMGRLGMPVLLLVGEGSPEPMQTTTQALATMLPNARVESLRGQQHNAMDTARELFLRAVIDFLEHH